MGDQGPVRAGHRRLHGRRSAGEAPAAERRRAAGDRRGAERGAARDDHRARRGQARVNRALDDWGVSKAKEIAALDRAAPPRKDVVFDALQELAKRERKQPARVAERRRWGAILLLTIAAGVVPLAVWSDSRWLLAVIAVVAALGAVNFMIARITPRFAWYGLAIFASVVLFGATLSVVDTIRSPKVQPVALLRNTDDRPICGAYVTETDDRVYIARVVPGEGGRRHQVQARPDFLDRPRRCRHCQRRPAPEGQGGPAAPQDPGERDRRRPAQGRAAQAEAGRDDNRHQAQPRQASRDRHHGAREPPLRGGDAAEREPAAVESCNPPTP